MSTIPMSSVEPPRWLWLWFPLLVQLVQRIAFLRDYTAYDLLYAESGAIEILTAVALAAGVVAGISVLRHRTPLPKWLRVWVAFVTLGCFYACGEELNWGQEIFRWETPAWLAAINGLGETNFHATSWWFNEAPRKFLWLFVLAGIIHITLLRRGVEKGWALFWPTYVCLPTALLAVLMRVPEPCCGSGWTPPYSPASTGAAGLSWRSLIWQCFCSCISCRSGIAWGWKEGGRAGISPSARDG